MPAKLSLEQINERLKDRGITVVGEYKGAGINIEFQCKCGKLWLGRPSHIMAGSGCPVCAGNQKLSKEIVNNRILNKGITLIGEYLGSGTKTNFKCSCGYIWSTKPSSIMSGVGCPSCAGSLPIPKNMINERLSKNGRNIKIIGEYVDTKTKTNFECCCGHIWSATASNILSGKGCPLCSVKIIKDKLRLTKEVVNNRIKDSGRNISMIGEYINANSKTEFKCICDNIWEATPGSVMAGNGCPKCADHGFSTGKPAWIYVLIFANFIKYGITNNLDQRLHTHLKNGQYTVALSKLYEDGAVAYNWERSIKIIFGGKYVTKEQCPDGWTETLSLDKLQLLMETVK